MRNYKKTNYDELKNSFIIAWGIPSGIKTLFRLMTSEATLALSYDGIWIGPDLSRNSAKLGFYKWDWVNRIAISRKDGTIMVVLNDFDNVVKAIVPTWQKLDFYAFMIVKNGSEKAILVTGDQIEYEYQQFINVISKYNLCKIEILE